MVSIEFLILWVVLSLVIGLIGSKKEIGFLYSFVLSLVFSPIIGIIGIAISSRKQEKEVINSADELKKWHELKISGAISEEEFEDKKRNIM